MKKFIIAALFAVVLIFIAAPDVKGDKIYEFEISESYESEADGAVSKFIESLPDEIKKELPESREPASFESFDVDFFVKKATDAVKKALVPTLKTVFVLLGTVILSAVFHIFSDTVTGGKLKDVFSFCSALCVALSVHGAMTAVFEAVGGLLKIISDTMLAIVPAMEAVHIASGNLTTAAVSATGVNLMIGFTESLFSRVISPAVYTAFILAVVSAVTKNAGVGFMSKTLRGLVGGAVIAIMALMTFVLALQTMGSNAQDNLTAKTVKFAMGAYIPIVGGSIAETFSMLSQSMGVIKQWCGITGIAVLIIAFLSPFASVLLGRIAVGVSGAMAAVLGCEREGVLLEECKGICSLLIAISASACVMFIVALGIFCTSSVAV